MKKENQGKIRSQKVREGETFKEDRVFYISVKYHRKVRLRSGLKITIGFGNLEVTGDPENSNSGEWKELLRILGETKNMSVKEDSHLTSLIFHFPFHNISECYFKISRKMHIK